MTEKEAQKNGGFGTSEGTVADLRDPPEGSKRSFRLRRSRMNILSTPCHDVQAHRAAYPTASQTRHCTLDWGLEIGDWGLGTEDTIGPQIGPKLAQVGAKLTQVGAKLV